VTPPSPSFARPPVSEVALAVYFSPSLALRTVHAGMIWERWREAYPRSEDQPVLPPVPPEDFGLPHPVFQVQFIGQPAGFRTWYLSEQGDRVVQIQPDRLVLNWRRLSEPEPYPRYETLRPEFEGLLNNLMDFCAAHEIGTGTIQHAEVSYTNPIPLEQVTGPGGAATLLAPWAGKYSDDFLPGAEDLGLSLRYRIPHPVTGEPAGRLYVQAGSVWKAGTADSPPRPTYLLQLFARGPVANWDMASAIEFLDLAHRWVVSGFASLTTVSMHELWGRYGE
jgi:uncharacterized protein (TIGR04255 family)